jgi:hypothetical protein
MCTVDRRVMTTEEDKNVFERQPMSCLIQREIVDHCLSVFNIVIFDFDKIWFDSLNYPCKKYIVFLEGLWFLPPDESVCKMK